MCEIIGSFPTAESVHRTLISLLEEQWGVKYDYELVVKKEFGKNEKGNQK